MADNSVETTADNAANTNPGKMPGSSIPIDAANLINLTPATENMEVHHHPDIHHNRKKWKEYFIEFVMIFLAVSMGFIAENFREHLSERAKEKQYIEGFVRNLKDDTASLRHVIASGRYQVKGLDSLLALAHANMAVDTLRKSFYHLVMKYCYNSSSFTSNDATLQQLKSTGDYRLIEKDHIADSLSRYDSEVHSIYAQGDYYNAYFKEILSRLDELADMTMPMDTAFITGGKLMNNSFPLLRTENGKLTTFFNKIYVFKIITTAYTENNLASQLENATRLIEFLTGKYGIRE